jgi:hypothetical protein
MPNIKDVPTAHAALLTVTYTATDNQPRTLTVTPHGATEIAMGVYDCTEVSTTPSEIKVNQGQVGDIQVTNNSIQITPNANGGCGVTLTLFMWADSTVIADTTRFDFSFEYPLPTGCSCSVQLGLDGSKTDYNQTITAGKKTATIFWPTVAVGEIA